jgi:NADPH2:quinone reductase
MRAALCRAFTGPDGIATGEAPDPVPADDEVLIDVHAASVTYMDVLMVSGGYQMKPPLPYVPGTECAGVVAAVGAKVTRVKPGDRVAGHDWYGGMAEKFKARENNIVALPDGLSFEAASTVLHNYDTAWYGLVLRAKLQKGETVVVTGAGGGVGMATVDLACHLGARVIGAVGSEAHAHAVREAGAADVINYRTENFRDRLKELGGKHGIDVGFDNVGGALFEDLARSMAWDGRLLPVGFAGGEIPKLAMNLPLLKNFSIVGMFCGAWQNREPQAKLAAENEVMRLVAEGKLKPKVGLVLPLEQTRQAMEAVRDRKASGRVVVKVR